MCQAISCKVALYIRINKYAFKAGFLNNIASHSYGRAFANSLSFSRGFFFVYCCDVWLFILFFFLLFLNILNMCEMLLSLFSVAVLLQCCLIFCCWCCCQRFISIISFCWTVFQQAHGISKFCTVFYNYYTPGDKFMLSYSSLPLSRSCHCCRATINVVTLSCPHSMNIQIDSVSSFSI